MADDDQDPQSKFVHSSDFRQTYANNVQFEISRIDLRVLFGITQSEQPTVQHTSVNLTWVEAKLVSYFLLVNLAIYETAILKKKIDILPEMLPPAPAEPSPDAGPQARVTYEKVVKLRDEFLASINGE